LDVIAMREAMEVLFKEDRLCLSTPTQSQNVQSHVDSIVGAPWFVPRDVQHLAQIRPLIQASSPLQGDAGFPRERQLLAILSSMDAPPNVVVTSMQVFFKYLRPAELGMLGDEQASLVESLLRIVSQHPHGPALLDAGVADREVA
jgi:hypothetical protein